MTASKTTHPTTAPIIIGTSFDDVAVDLESEIDVTFGTPNKTPKEAHQTASDRSKQSETQSSEAFLNMTRKKNKKEKWKKKKKKKKKKIKK